MPIQILSRLTSSLCCQDDMGVEGVIILPDSHEKRVRIGTGVSSSQTKRTEHVDSKSAASAREKAEVQMSVNTKDCEF